MDSGVDLRTMSSASAVEAPVLGPKKTVFVMVIVVGCIAILWPKVFYPMLIGGGQPIPQQKNFMMKDHRGGPGCCGVVLDSAEFANVSHLVGEKTYHKTLQFHHSEDVISLRQERPPHLRPDSIHPAMKERGRAIPTQTVPIIERVAAAPPRLVDGRPGPIPGMRPPMGGGGSVHQQPPKTNMGFIMPLYTIGIVSFFVYTIMKIIFKKSPGTEVPYPVPLKPDPNFRAQVFANNDCKNFVKRPETNGKSKLENDDIMSESGEKTKVTDEPSRPNANGGVLKRSDRHDNDSFELRETEDLMDIDQLKRRLQETEDRMAKIISQMGSIVPKVQNGIVDKVDKDDKQNQKSTDIKGKTEDKQKVQVLGMELTSSCEGGKKWDKSLVTNPAKAKPEEAGKEEPQSIYLEGTLPHKSNILVADAETVQEEFVDRESEDGGEENDEDAEPAIVLSSKMTLSLISLDQQDRVAAVHESDKMADKEKGTADENIETINGSDY